MATNAPRFSVVICTYQRRDLVLEALDTVFGQAERDFEVLVVDDGSTDGTAEALAGYPRPLRLLRQENRGPSAARNLGAAEARGTWLAFLDSDDGWEPQYLQRARAFLESQPDVGLLAPGMRIIAPDGARTERCVFKKSPTPYYSTEGLLSGDIGTIITPVIRRDRFLAAGGFDASLRSAEDCDLWLRLSFLTRLAHLAEPLLLYRSHPQNLSRNVRLNAECWLALLDRFEREHPDFVARHRGLVRRFRAKQLVRYGREVIAAAASVADPAAFAAEIALARDALSRASRLDAKPKTLLYLALCSTHGAPALFARWRRFELSRKEKLANNPLSRALAERRRRDAQWTQP